MTPKPPMTKCEEKFRDVALAYIPPHLRESYELTVTQRQRLVEWSAAWNESRKEALEEASEIVELYVSRKEMLRRHPRPQGRPMTSKQGEGEIEAAWLAYEQSQDWPPDYPGERLTWQAACEWMREQAIQHADAEARDDGTAQRIIERLRGVR